MPLALFCLGVTAALVGIALLSIPAALIVGGIAGAWCALYVDLAALWKGGRK